MISDHGTSESRPRRSPCDSSVRLSRSPCGRYPACGRRREHHPSAYWTSASPSTRSRIRSFRNFGVTSSTRRPPRSLESSCSSRMKAKPGTWPASNSTRTSMSLSGRKSSRRTEPNKASRRMWFLRQKSAIFSRSMGIRARMFRGSRTVRVWHSPFWRWRFRRSSLAPGRVRPGGRLAPRRHHRPPLSAKPGHDLASEQLHRAPHARLGQAPEVHPAQHLADTEAPQLVDLLRDRVGRAEGDGLGDELVPRDLPEPLCYGAEPGLQERVHALDLLGDEKPSQGLLVPQLRVLRLGQGLGVGRRDVDVTRDFPLPE